MLNVIDIKEDLPQSGAYPKRLITDITHIDIHHSATLRKNYKGFETIKGFANYHIGKGWEGLGYHYVVGLDKVYKTGYANEMRWSVGGNNSYTLSIMLIGNFTVEDIQEDQYNRALELAHTVRKAYNVPVENVMGHKEFPDQATECPGIDMENFRRDLKVFNI